MTRSILLAAALAALLFPAASHANTDAQIQDAVASASPRVLSPEDVRRYREIFADEADGRFAAARILIENLSDRSLMGYVEAEHYLSPYMRRPPVKELARWLDEYAELPIAPRVRELAEERNAHLRRRHRVALAGVPAVPVRPVPLAYEVSAKMPDPPLATDAARMAQLGIDGDVKLDQSAAAEVVLEQLASENIAPPSDIARLTYRVAAGYLEQGLDDDASRVAAKVTGLDRDAAPLLDWVNGLAAYRQKKIRRGRALVRASGTERRRTRVDAQRCCVLGRTLRSGRRQSAACCRPSDRGGARAAYLLRPARPACAWSGIVRPVRRSGA